MYQTTPYFMQQLACLPSLICPDSARSLDRKEELARGVSSKKKSICSVNSCIANTTPPSDRLMFIKCQIW